MAPKGNKKPAAKKAAPAPAKQAAAKPAPKKAAAKPAAKKESAKKSGAPKLGVYVKGLNFPGLSNETVAETFAKCGKVTEVRLRHGKYCIVFFADESAIKKARELNNKVVKGQKISVEEAKKAKPTRPRAQYCTSVFVGNLPGGTNEEQLKAHFGSCGKIVRTRIYKAKHHGFVYFDTNAAAKKAVAMADTPFAHGKSQEELSQKYGETVPAQLQRKLEITFSVRTKKGDQARAKKRYERRPMSQIEAAEKKSAHRAELRAAAKAAKASGSGSGSKGSKTRKGSRKSSSKK